MVTKTGADLHLDDLDDETMSAFKLRIKHYAKRRKAFCTVLLILALWLFVPTSIYWGIYGWPYATCAYYAAQAGLSIGFGALSEDNELSKVFTIVHVLAGSSFIAGALALFVTVTVEKTHMDWDKAMHKRLGDAVENKEITAQETDQKQTCCARCCSKLRNTHQQKPMLIRIIIVSITWLFIGFAYGTFYEDWGFTDSLYFSITAMSTAGLQAPTADLEGGSFRMVFVLLFVLTGVPVYGMVLGQAANLLVGDYESDRLKRSIKKQLSAAQIQFAMSFNGQNDDLIEFPDFLQFTVLRLGICDLDFLQDIYSQFQALDVDKSGFLEKDELYATMTFGQFDCNNNGKLSMPEFIVMFRHLVREVKVYSDIDTFHDPKAGEACFNDLDEDDNGFVTRNEFMHFFEFVFQPESAQEFFTEHGEEWLQGNASMPLPSRVESDLKVQKAMELHGRDLDAAIELLDEAVAISPNRNRRAFDLRRQYQEEAAKTRGVQQKSLEAKTPAPQQTAMQRMQNNRDKAVTRKLVHFYKWFQSEEGEKWMASNEAAWQRGRLKLPDAATLRGLKARQVRERKAANNIPEIQMLEQPVNMELPSMHRRQRSVFSTIMDGINTPRFQPPQR